jgi:hypothetical protein
MKMRLSSIKRQALITKKGIIRKLSVKFYAAFVSQGSAFSKYQKSQATTGVELEQWLSNAPIQQWRLDNGFQKKLNADRKKAITS